MNQAVVSAEPAMLKLLLFSTGDTRFGVDLEQIAAMTGLDEERDSRLNWFHDLVKFGNKTVQYQSPTILSVKTINNQPFQVIIDQMEDILECSANAIAPLPALLEQHLLNNGIWGLLQSGNQIVLLVDFQRIADHQSTDKSNTMKECSP